jgi:hypothetical protein
MLFDQPKPLVLICVHQLCTDQHWQQLQRYAVTSVLLKLLLLACLHRCRFNQTVSRSALLSSSYVLHQLHSLAAYVSIVTSKAVDCHFSFP